MTLEFAAYNNMLDEPLLTVSKASKAGRRLYYEVPQAPVGVLAFFHGARRSWMLAKGVSAAVPGGGALVGAFVWLAGKRLARSLHGVSRTVRASRPLVPAELTTRAPWLRPTPAGCAHNAYDLWPPQLGCEECRGECQGPPPGETFPACCGQNWTPPRGLPGRSTHVLPAFPYRRSPSPTPPPPHPSNPPPSHPTPTQPSCRPAWRGVPHQAGAVAGLCCGRHEFTGPLQRPFQGDVPLLQARPGRAGMLGQPGLPDSRCPGLSWPGAVMGGAGARAWPRKKRTAVPSREVCRTALPALPTHPASCFPTGPSTCAATATTGSLQWRP